MDSRIGRVQFTDHFEIGAICTVEPIEEVGHIGSFLRLLNWTSISHWLKKCFYQLEILRVSGSDLQFLDLRIPIFTTAIGAQPCVSGSFGEKS